MHAHTSHDFDAFADTVRDADMDMIMCNLKRRTWDLRFADIGGIHVQVGDLGSGNLVRGQGGKDQHLVYLPLSGDNRSTWNGAVLRRGTFGILPSGSDFTLSERDAHQWVSIAIPSRLVSDYGDSVNPEKGVERWSSRVTRVQPALAHRIAEAVFDILGAAASCAAFESSPAAKSASKALLHMALPVLGKSSAIGSARGGRPRVSRQAIVDGAMATVEEAGNDPVSVGKMAAAAGVSERTLRNAFYDCFGMGPLRYLELRQVRNVHRELSAKEPDGITVTRVLVGNGVWQWGRFAARYRRVVGELPSETLRRSG